MLGGDVVILAAQAHSKTPHAYAHNMLGPDLHVQLAGPTVGGHCCH